MIHSSSSRIQWYLYLASVALRGSKTKSANHTSCNPHHSNLRFTRKFLQQRLAELKAREREIRVQQEAARLS